MRCPDFELVVQDNSDNDNLSSWVDGYVDDPRLRYSWIRKRRSISENFELAIGRARGNFVCIVGDDDGISPCVIRLTRWMEENRIDAMSPTLCTQYYWPGVKSPIRGCLVSKPFTGKLTLCNPEEQLLKCVRSGGTRPFKLPRVYHGVVRRKCLDAVRQQSGSYAPGISPDMAASVSLASFVNSVCSVDYPVFVPGASTKSGAGRGVQKTHHGDLSDESFLEQRYVESWPQRVPAFFSGPTMWGAATVQALQATGREDYIKQFSFTALHAACAVFVPSYRCRTLSSFREISQPDGLSSLLAWAKLFAACSYHGLRRARQLVTRRIEIPFTNNPTDFSNIDNAMISLKRWLVKMPLRLPESGQQAFQPASLKAHPLRAVAASGLDVKTSRVG